MGCVGVVGFVLKMLEDVPNHCRILNVGNHFDVTATAYTNFNIDIKHPLKPLHPGYGPVLQEQKPVIAL